MFPGVKTLWRLCLSFLLLWLGLRFLLPLVLPFLLGGALALSAEPVVTFLRRLRLPRAAASFLAVTAAFCLLAALVVVLCAFAIRELGLLAPILPDLAEAARSGAGSLESWLLSLGSRAPGSLGTVLNRGISSLFSDGTALLDKAVSYALGLAGSVLKALPDSALTLGTAVISGYMISAKLPAIRSWLKSRIPRDRLQRMLENARRIRRVLGKFLLAQLQLGGVTLAVLAAGFFILGIAYGPVWALVIALVDAFPVLGTGTILLPWALLSLLRGNGAQAAGLLGIYITATVLRSVLEPKLLGRHLGLDPLVTLAAMYMGFQLWGLPGMLLSPMITVTALQLVPEGGSRE